MEELAGQVEQPSEAWQMSEQEAVQLLIQRGQESRSLLSNPALDRWLRDSEYKWFEAFERTPLNDPLGRDRCVTVISLLRQLKKDLTEEAREGEEALSTLRDLEERK